MTDRETCPHCGSTNTSLWTSEAEIIEGPKRGVTKTVNVELCDECDGVVDAEPQIPAVEQGGRDD